MEIFFEFEYVFLNSVIFCYLSIQCAKHDYYDYWGNLRACNIVAFYAYTRSYFGNYNSEILFDFDDGHYFLIRLIHSLYEYVTGREIFSESIHLILKKENDIVCIALLTCFQNIFHFAYLRNNFQTWSSSSSCPLCFPRRFSSLKNLWIFSHLYNWKKKKISRMFARSKTYLIKMLIFNPIIHKLGQ